MKYMLLVLTIISLSAQANLNPVISKLIAGSVLDQNVLSLKHYESSRQIVSCESIKVRARQYHDVLEEVERLNRRIDGESIESEIDSYHKILQFVLGNSPELFDLLLTFSSIRFNAGGQVTNNNNLAFSLHAGELRIFFPYDELTFYASNYQLCFDDTIDLFIVDNCKVRQFLEIENCLGHEVRHIELELPTVYDQDSGRSRGGIFD